MKIKGIVNPCTLGILPALFSAADCRFELLFFLVAMLKPSSDIIDNGIWRFKTSPRLTAKAVYRDRTWVPEVIKELILLKVNNLLLVDASGG